MSIITVMIIGLVLLGLTVILMFFGVAQRVFKSFGVTYWLAFVIVGALIGCAFVPTLHIGRVSVSIAGSVAPVAFGIVFFALAHKVRETGHAIVAAAAVTAAYMACELMLSPVLGGFGSAMVSGAVCGAVAYTVGKTRLSAVCAAFTGIPAGDIAASAVGYFAYGNALRIGSAPAFDAVILAAVFALVIYEAVAAIRRAVHAKNKALAEAAEEFDPDEYKRYFDE